MHAKRFTALLVSSGLAVSRAIAVTAILVLVCVPATASAQTLERIRDTGHFRLGYFLDASPFTERNEGGQPEGYAVVLCHNVADQVRTTLGLPQLAVDWVPVSPEQRLQAVRNGDIDLLCAPTSVTLDRREEVSFSIPIFAGGTRAVLRADARQVLRDALAEDHVLRPVWRGSPAAKVLEGTTFAVVSGTTSEQWLAERSSTLQVDAKVVPVVDYREGLEKVLDRKVDVFFGDRSVVLEAMEESERDKLLILDRMFTHESIAFALARGDDDFRLLVDRTLSETYVSSGFAELFTSWIGVFDDRARRFFQWSSLAQ